MVVVTESTGTLAQFTAGGQPRLANRLDIDGVNADLAIDPRGLGVSRVSGALPASSTSGGTQTLVPLGDVDEVQISTSLTTSEHARTLMPRRR